MENILVFLGKRHQQLVPGSSTRVDLPSMRIPHSIPTAKVVGQARLEEVEEEKEEKEEEDD